MICLRVKMWGHVLEMVVKWGAVAVDGRVYLFNGGTSCQNFKAAKVRRLRAIYRATRCGCLCCAFAKACDRAVITCGSATAGMHNDAGAIACSSLVRSCYSLPRGYLGIDAEVRFRGMVAFRVAYVIVQS
jgi:hypothetical protein